MWVISAPLRYMQSLNSVFKNKRVSLYLVNTCVVKKGQQRSTEGTGTTFIIDHSHINVFGVSTNAQAHQTDLNYRQQKLETEGPEHKPEKRTHIETDYLNRKQLIIMLVVL